MTTPGFPAVAEFDPNPNEHRRRLAQAVNSLRRGKMNVTIDVTLAVSAASTVVNDPRIGVSSVLLFSPLTASAAAELATLYVDSAAQLNGQATIMHTNSATADRTFRIAIVG